MQFSVIQTRVAEETGLNTTADATKIKAWINGAYQQLAGFFEWPWLLTNFTLQTVADKTALTATVAAGATAVTLSTTVAPTLAGNYMIQFTTESNNWYLISAHTTGQATLTLANAFVGAANYTSGVCKIRKVFYDLPSTVDRLIDLRQSITKLKIELVDSRTFDKIIPDPDNTGTPAYAYLTGMTSAGAWQLTFYPLPSAVINIQGRGYLNITELDGDTDVPLIPAKWHNVLIFLALALYGHDYIDDSRVQTAQARAKTLVAEMLKEYNPFPGEMHVIQPWDTRSPRGLMGVKLPANYPWPWGC